MGKWAGMNTLLNLIATKVVNATVFHNGVNLPCHVYMNSIKLMEGARYAFLLQITRFTQQFGEISPFLKYFEMENLGHLRGIVIFDLEFKKQP